MKKRRKLSLALISFLLLAFAALLKGLVPASAENTDAQLRDMVDQERYIFQVDRPTNPTREVDVVFDVKGFHIVEQSKEIFFQNWTEIERVKVEGTLIVTYFAEHPSFAVPRAQLKYQGVIDQFLIFAQQQTVNARATNN